MIAAHSGESEKSCPGATKLAGKEEDTYEVLSKPETD
jgi:hypothetical protein